jgi:ribosomal protein L14E/L6E/L27E
LELEIVLRVKLNKNGLTFCSKACSGKKNNNSNKRTKTNSQAPKIEKRDSEETLWCQDKQDQGLQEATRRKKFGPKTGELQALD